MGREIDEGQEKQHGSLRVRVSRRAKILKQEWNELVLSQLIHTKDHPGGPNLQHCVGLWVLRKPLGLASWTVPCRNSSG